MIFLLLISNLPALWSGDTHTSCEQETFEHSETYLVLAYSTRKKGTVFSLGRSGDKRPIGGLSGTSVPVSHPFSICMPVCHLLISHSHQGTLFLSHQLVSASWLLKLCC